VLDILDIAEVIGIISFALSGFFVASGAKLDLLGVFIASFLTALGGGVIRDIIADKSLYAFTNNLASMLVIVVVGMAIFFKIQRFNTIENNILFILSDTLGLVSFAISGAMVGIDVGFNFFGVILLSLITAVGGGVLRDMLINEVPIILTSEFYGSVALVVGTLIYLLQQISSLNVWTILIVFIIGVLLRFVALYRDWHLPKVI